MCAYMYTGVGGWVSVCEYMYTGVSGCVRVHVYRCGCVRVHVYRCGCVRVHVYRCGCVRVHDTGVCMVCAQSNEVKHNVMDYYPRHTHSLTNIERLYAFALLD